MEHGWLSDRWGDLCIGKVDVVPPLFGSVEEISISHGGRGRVEKQ